MGGAAAVGCVAKPVLLKKTSAGLIIVRLDLRSREFLEFFRQVNRQSGRDRVHQAVPALTYRTCALRLAVSLCRLWLPFAGYPGKTKLWSVLLPGTGRT